MEEPVISKETQIRDLLQKLSSYSMDYERVSCIQSIFSLLGIKYGLYENEIGSKNSENFSLELKELVAGELVESLKRDRASSVRAEAALALGALGIMNQKVIDALLDGIYEFFTSKIGKKVSDACLDSLQKLGINSTDPKYLLNHLFDVISKPNDNQVYLSYCLEILHAIVMSNSKFIDNSIMCEDVCKKLVEVIKHNQDYYVVSQSIRILADIRHFTFTADEKNLLLSKQSDKRKTVQDAVQYALNTVPTENHSIDEIKKYLERQMTFFYSIGSFRSNSLDRPYESKLGFYKGHYNTRTTDKLILDKLVCKTLNIDIKTFLKVEHEFKYLGHLMDRAGTIFKTAQENRNVKDTGEELEGFDDLKSFLPLRIRFLVGLVVKIKYDEIPEKTLPLPKVEMISLLERELSIQTQIYQNYADLQYINTLRIDDTKKEELRKFYNSNIAKKISELQDGEEYSYYSGYQGHALYVNFVKANDQIYIRIDNLGDGPDKHTLKDIDGVLYRDPYVLGPIDITGQRFLIYLGNINATKYYNQAEPGNRKIIFDGIYEDAFGHGNSIPVYPKKIQRVGNCIVKNLNAGMMARLMLNDSHDKKQQRRLYSWVRSEEMKYALDRKTKKPYQGNLFEKQTTTVLELGQAFTKVTLH